MGAMPQRLAPTNGRKTETRGLFPVACDRFYNLEQRQVGGLCCPFREACRAPTTSRAGDIAHLVQGLRGMDAVRLVFPCGD
jgi:hypothetical protein